MNRSHSSGRVARTGKAPLRPPLRGIAFKVFIGYADLAAARDATATIADAVHASRRKFEIHPLLWRFDQLADSHWQDRAIKAALGADVVVLASSKPDGIGSEIDAWVSAFLRANRGRRATLVAIAGPTDAWTISIEEPATKQFPSAAGAFTAMANTEALELADTRF